MTDPGVDYAWSHPGGAALQAAGVKFACRYLSSDRTKRLTDTEAADLAAHGVSSVVVWEDTAKRPLSGYAAGVEDAKDAVAQATAAGMPNTRPIYFACDWDATPTDQTAINAYLDGAASVIGRDRVGVYGGYYVVKRALDAGKARWAWQTFAWSGGQWDSRAHIRQGSYVTINGVQCDKDTSMQTDYGQWMPGKAPVEGFTMATKDDVATFAHTDGIYKAPDFGNTKVSNQYWTDESYKRETYLRIRELTALVKALDTKNDAQTAVINKLMDAITAGPQADLDALKAEIRQAIESVTVHLDVPNQA